MEKINHIMILVSIKDKIYQKNIKDNILNCQNEEKTRHQRTKTEFEKTKNELRQNLELQWSLYTRDMAIKNLLGDTTIDDGKKIAAIKKLMENTRATPDPGRIAAGDEATKLYAENATLMEDKAFLEQEIHDMKQKYEQDVQEWKQKYELEHSRAVMLAVATPLNPPSPPRRGKTNPFL